MYILLSLILVILGMIMVLKPKLFFDIAESWKSHTNNAPSDLYIFSTRLGGIMCLLAGVFALVVFML